MLYAVGTHIDLRAHVFTAPVKPVEEPVRQLYEPGTRISFVTWMPKLGTLQVAT